MKRILQKRASEALRAQALEQMRLTSAYLERELPGLLTEVRERVGYTQEPVLSVPIDRKKNIETVLKFIALKPALKSRIAEYPN
jgi:hypothetical protein